MLTRLISSLPVLLLTVKAWEFDVYDSRGCNQGLLKDNSGTEDVGCTKIDQAGRAKFILYEMGDCSIEFYSGSDDTCPESNFEQIYDAFNQEQCIGPRYDWNYFLVTSC